MYFSSKFDSTFHQTSHSSTKTPVSNHANHCKPVPQAPLKANALFKYLYKFQFSFPVHVLKNSLFACKQAYFIWFRTWPLQFASMSYQEPPLWSQGLSLCPSSCLSKLMLLEGGCYRNGNYFEFLWLPVNAWFLFPFSQLLMFPRNCYHQLLGLIEWWDWAPRKCICFL